MLRSGTVLFVLAYLATNVANSALTLIIGSVGGMQTCRRPIR